MKNSFIYGFCLLTIIMLGCSKEPIGLDTSGEISMEKNREAPALIELFYIDEQEVTYADFERSPKDYYLHSVISKRGNDDLQEHFLFSTRAQYETWGDEKGWGISIMNQAEAEVEQLAAAMGISPDEEGTNVSDAFAEQADSIMNNAVTSVPAFLCYLGMRLNTQMCDPNVPPGSPWACSGSNFSLFYPVPNNQAILEFMNNKVSAWIANKANFCSGTSFAHLRGFDKAFYFKKIGTITVCLSCAPGGYLFVPFNNTLSKYNDKISSFQTWGTANP